MVHPKFHALAELVSQRRQEHLDQIHRQQPQPCPFPEERDPIPAPSQMALTFEDLSPVLEVYQRFDEDHREIEWSFYSGTGEFLLQFGFSLAEGRYQIHSIHPELFLAREEMRGYCEAINRRLGTGYPLLELVLDAERKPLIQRKAN
ncbi:MAG: hypothetical protein U1F66_02640 [bacterium]